VLPVVCFGIVTRLRLEPELAVGLLLVAASPGGTTAGLFSHLARGDVALNLTLTAVNSGLSLVTLPLIVNLAVAHFQPEGSASVGLGLAEIARLLALILVPAALGMTVRARRRALAARLDRPIRVLAVACLALIAVATVLHERHQITGYLGPVGLAALTFCLASLFIGYWLPRRAGVTGAQAVAIGMDVGIHNSGLAVTIALDPAMLGSSRIAVPAVIYAILTIPCAAVAARVWSHSRKRKEITV
jgi:bile acid:Na+ symporter, BASS family